MMIVGIRDDMRIQAKELVDREAARDVSRGKTTDCLFESVQEFGGFARIFIPYLVGDDPRRAAGKAK
jgi:hypothetical protein